MSPSRCFGNVGGATSAPSFLSYMSAISRRASFTFVTSFCLALGPMSPMVTFVAHLRHEAEMERHTNFFASVLFISAKSPPSVEAQS